jgi:formylglycine-generating enzyme required for sulfatase activity
MRFRVIAEDGNTAPTISDIANVSVPLGSATGAISFTLGDTQTPASSLTLSGSSSNKALVPNSGIVFGGSGPNRTVTVTPIIGQSGTSSTITVTVSDGSLSASDTFVLSIADVALIPAGAFEMGSSAAGEGPTHAVALDAYYIGKYEVTKAEWDQVRLWALSNGYTDLAAGSGKASNHPVQTIDWYQMVKWCNARSQKEGLTPVYYTDDAQTTIYKTGNIDITNTQVRWKANGYRLPTEAEWEKAARGGLSGKLFPWGDTISHSKANYKASSYFSYDLSGSVNGYHPSYSMELYLYEGYPYTSPVGDFAANGYGLYDIAGNVWELCWDWYGEYAAGSQSNPLGANSGGSRMLRGGGFDAGASSARVSNRSAMQPFTADGCVGFRVARSSVP